MDKSIFIIIVAILGVILLIAVFDGLKSSITAGTVAVGCNIACSSNADCDDENNCTNDVCMYPGSCEALCYHSLIESCK